MLVLLSAGASRVSRQSNMGQSRGTTNTWTCKADTVDADQVDLNDTDDGLHDDHYGQETGVEN